MAQLLRLLPDPDRARKSRSVDPPQTAHVSLAAVAERTQSLQGAAPQRRSQVPRCGRCRLTDRALPYVRASGGRNGTAQPRLRRSRPAPPPCRPLKLNPIEPPCTDPYARWCGRGGAARRPPIPILGQQRRAWTDSFRRTSAVRGPAGGARVPIPVMVVAPMSAAPRWRAQTRAKTLPA